MSGKIVWGANGPRYFIDRKEVTEAAFREAFPDKPLAGAPGGHHPACWPMVSDAAAVHPSQVAEAEASAKAKGVPTNFDGDGRPVFTGRGHRKAYLKAYGFHDNHGGYGD